MCVQSKRGTGGGEGRGKLEARARLKYGPGKKKKKGREIIRLSGRRWRKKLLKGSPHDSRKGVHCVIRKTCERKREGYGFKNP